MQTALDATSLAMIKTASAQNAGQITSSASSMFAANFNHPEITNAAVTATYDSSSGILTLYGTASQKNAFMGIAGYSQTGLSAVSKSMLGNRMWPICVLITNPTDGHTLLVSGASTIDFTNCMVQVNTNNWDAVEARDTSYIHSSNGNNCFVGDIHYGDVTPAKNPTCTMFADPYTTGYTLPASASTCTYTNLKVTVAGTTLSPGTYCGGLTIQKNATLSPGLYIMKAGDFNVSGTNTNVTATGVTVLMTGSNAGITINTTGTITMSPADSSAAGVFAGFSFFLDQSTTNYLDKSQVQSATMNMSGVLYLKGQKLIPDKNAVITINTGVIIADEILPVGGSKLNLTGTLSSPTAVQQAMKKSLPSNTPVLVQ